MKKWITNPLDLTIDSAGAILSLTQIAEGDQVFGRQGTRIIPKFMSFKWTVQANTLPATTTLPPVVVRLMIFQDTQMDGTAPTVAKVLANENASGVIAANCYSALNEKYPGRFKVYWDKLFICNPTAGATVAGTDYIYYSGHVGKKYVKLGSKVLPITYTDGGSTDYSNGQFFILYISDVDEAAAFDLQWRLGYTDS